MERRKEQAGFGTPECSQKGDNRSDLVGQLCVKLDCEEFTMTREDGSKRQSTNPSVINDTGMRLLGV